MLLWYRISPVPLPTLYTNPMEIHGIGPCVFIDTAGFDDNGELGSLRIERTVQAVDKTDIALMVCCDTELSEEKRWIGTAERKKASHIY